MKNTVINLLVILGIVLVTFFGTRAYYPEVEEVVRTDTVEIDKPYVLEKVVEKEVPVRVTEYKTDTVEVTSTEVVKDTVFINTDLNSFAYDAKFLTQYPNSPRFLGLQHKNNELEITYQTTDGNVQGKTWTAPQGYRVGLNNGQPNIETFADQPEDRLSYTVGVGMMYGRAGLSPYLTLNAEFLILGVKPTTSVYVGEQSFITAGINYEF